MRFSYQGSDGQGKEAQGTLEAISLSGAARELRERGIVARTLKRDDWREEPLSLGEMDAFSYFNRNLASSSRLGIPLPRAIREIARGLRRGRFRTGLERIEAALREGKSLQEALGENPGAFPPYYRWLVKAGTVSGNLPGVLQSVSRAHEGLRRVRRALVGALAYPAIVLCISGILVTAFLAYCLPTYQELYFSKLSEPSFLSEVVFRLFHSPAVPVAILSGFLLLLYGGVLWMRYTSAGERTLYRLPLLGKVLRLLSVSRVLGTLSYLLRLRVPLSETVPIGIEASGSVQLSREAERMRARAEEGESLSQILGQSKVVPGQLASYLQMAEQTGGAPEACRELSEMLLEQASAASDTMYAVLFPLAIVATGAIIGSVILLVVLPYLQILKGLPL